MGAGASANDDAPPFTSVEEAIANSDLPPHLRGTVRTLLISKHHSAPLDASGGGIGAQLRKLCGLGRAVSGVPQAVLLDLGVGGYVKLESADVTKDTIATLLREYRAGKLELQSPNPAR